MIKKLLFIIINFSLIIGCDNREFKEDINVLTAFPFEFSLEDSNQHYLKSVGDIYLTISNTHEIKNQKYNVFYTILGGDGEIFTSGNLSHENFYLNKGKTPIGFKGLNTGECILQLTAKNGKEVFNKTIETKIVVEKRPFEASVTAQEEVFRTEKNSVTGSIKVDNPGWITYSWKYKSNQDNEIKNIDGTVISTNQEQDIIPNKENKFFFNPKENIGEHVLFFTFKDKQGLSIVQDLIIKVKDIDFDIQLEPINKQVFFDETAKILFNFKPEFISKTNPNKYTLTYFVEDGEGEIMIDGQIIKNGGSFELKNIPFDNKNVIFIPTKWGNIAYIKFVISDKYGYKKEVSTSIDFKRKPFDFFVNKRTIYAIEAGSGRSYIDLDLRSDADDEIIKYNLRIASHSNDKGKIRYNGRFYNLNDDIPISIGKSAIEYLPEAYGTGNHILYFEVTDITGQQPKQEAKEIAIEIEKSPKIISLNLFNFCERKYVGWLNGGHDYQYTYAITYKLELGKGEKINYIKIEGYDRWGNKNSINSGLRYKNTTLGESIGHTAIWVDGWQGKPNPMFYIGTTFKVYLKTTRNRILIAESVIME